MKNKVTLVKTKNKNVLNWKKAATNRASFGKCSNHDNRSDPLFIWLKDPKVSI